MWLFTPRGFYSAVQHKQQPDTIVVRTRVRPDMERLVELVERHTGSRPEVLEWAGTDYRFRALLPRHVWAIVLNDMVAELTYTNFKNAAHKVQDEGAAGRDHTYDAIWQAMYRFQSMNKSK